MWPRTLAGRTGVGIFELKHSELLLNLQILPWTSLSGTILFMTIV
jgi:hypothetical protein